MQGHKNLQKNTDDYMQYIVRDIQPRKRSLSPAHQPSATTKLDAVVDVSSQIRQFEPTDQMTEKRIESQTLSTANIVQ